MKLNGWLLDWVSNTALASRRRVWRMRRRVEHLEQRCLLTHNIGQLPSPEWFAVVNSAEPENSSGTLTGATGVNGAFSGDVSVGTWIVQLTPESLAAIHSPSAAETVLDGFGADFSVLRGLGLPGQLLVQVSPETREHAAAALRSNPLVSMFEADTYVIGPQEATQLTPTDASFSELAGMDNRGQTGGTADADIDAPEAWSYVDSKLAPDVAQTQVGSRKVVVGVIDSGMDYTHPDLVRNVFLNQGEITSSLRTTLQDTDGDGLITFVDLNATQNATTRQVNDTNGNGYIDGSDLLADPDWANQQDNDSNGFVDDLIGWDFSTSITSTNGTVISTGDNNPGLTNDPGSLHRHGTHVAGTIGAVGNNGIGVTGVSWAVSLLPLRFLDANNKGLTSNAISAINYATLMKVKYQATLADSDLTNDGKLGANVRVTNNSWGGTSGSSSLREAVAAEGAADILFVAAAGNGNALGRGNDNDLLPFFPSSYEIDNVISVAAVDSTDRLVEFSNYGVRSVDIAAPGLGILSTIPGGQYGRLNGTSMATPHVSGVAALIASLSPNADFSEIKAAILNGVDVISGLANRVQTGGRLNAFNAVTRDTIRPRALLDVPNITDADAGAVAQEFTVTYSDNVSVDVTSFDAGDVVVTRSGTNDSFTATLRFVQSGGNGPQRSVVYSIAAPGGSWDSSDNGTYFVSLRDGQVRDTNANFAQARTLGSFQVTVSRIGQVEVTSTADSIDVTPGNGVVADAQGRKTLRAAVMETNALAGDNTIVLPAGLYSLTLSGTGENSSSTGDLDVTGPLSILGATNGRTVIDAATLDRVFDVRPGASLTLQNLTLTGGRTPSGEHGGGLRNAGLLTLINVTINGNATAGDGGAIANPAGSTAVITNSTLSTNQALRGGAIFDGGSLTLLNTTIANNTATTAGGIFSDTGATARAKNSLIATNTAPTGPDLAGAFVSDGNNLIGKSTGSTGFTRDVAGNKVGTTKQPLDPRLGPLADNGGPTFTHDLLSGSPAIDAGNNSGAPVTDQRINVRLTNGQGIVDIGAVEQVFASIQGIKFHDLNANGVQELNEPGLPNFRIYLDLNHNGVRETTEPSTLTAANGSYTFTRVPPGNYDVLEESRDGYEQTSPLTLAFATSSLTTGGGPTAVATADLNGDSKPDLAVADQLSHDIKIFLNTGLGTFQSAITVALPNTAVPTAITAADFDADGRVDLAIASNVTNTVTLLRNQGADTFVLGTPLAVGTNPVALSAGRLDADADLDLVVINGDTATAKVLLNNGSGVFTISSTLTLTSGSNPGSSSLADFDRDGDLDLVIANRGTNSLTFYANGGNATFSVGLTINSGGLIPVAITTADFNADGFSDIAVANSGTASGSSVAVHLNRGDATFLSPVTFSGGTTPVVLNAADIDGDGALDLVVLNQSTNALSILLNTRETSAGTTSGQSGPATLPSDGTVNSSKTKKIASGTNGGPTLANYGNFGSSVTPLGDLDGDGVTDLAVGARSDSTFGLDRGAVYSLLMNANGTVKSSVKLASGTNGVPQLADGDFFGSSVASVGDFNADGVTDLAVGATKDATGGSLRGAVYLLLMNANGSVASSVKIASNTNGGPTLASGDFFGASVASLGDLNADGVTDLAVGATGDDTGASFAGAVYVLLMNSNGTVKNRVKLASSTNGAPALAASNGFGQSITSLEPVMDLT